MDRENMNWYDGLLFFIIQSFPFILSMDIEDLVYQIGQLFSGIGATYTIFDGTIEEYIRLRFIYWYTIQLYITSMYDWIEYHSIGYCIVLILSMLMYISPYRYFLVPTLLSYPIKYYYD